MQVINLNKKRVCDLSNDKKVVQIRRGDWCSSSNANDQRAVTIECASDTTPPYAFKDVVYQMLIKLCVDICKRNGKTKLLWLGDKNKTLAYSPKAGKGSTAGWGRLKSGAGWISLDFATRL